MHGSLQVRGLHTLKNQRCSLVPSALVESPLTTRLQSMELACNEQQGIISRHVVDCTRTHHHAAQAAGGE